MDEERKKGITIVVGSTSRLGAGVVAEALRGFDIAKVVEAEDYFREAASKQLPGLGLGLMTDVAGIPLDVRPKPYVPTRARQGKRPPKHLKRK